MSAPRAKAPIAVRAARAAAPPAMEMRLQQSPRTWRDRLRDPRSLDSMRVEHEHLAATELHDGWGVCRCVLASVIRELVKARTIEP